MASRMHLYVPRQSVTDQVSGVKNTLSSWDSCMQKTYCKWPVIAVIIAVSLILISIIWCCARCLCCGLECCCGCLSCCNACCPSPRGRKNKGYQNSEPPPQPYGGPPQQYQSAAMPVYNNQLPSTSPSAAGALVPQFATFDVHKPLSKADEDKLPAMPSWETAAKKQVLVEEPPEQVEMDELKKKEETMPMMAPGARSPGAGQSPGGYGGRSPNGTPGNRPALNPQQTGASGYFGAAGMPNRSPGRSPMSPPQYQRDPRGNGPPPGRGPYGADYRGQPTSPPGPDPYDGGYLPPPSGSDIGGYGGQDPYRATPSPRPGPPGPRRRPGPSPGPYGAPQMPQPSAYGVNGYAQQRSPNGYPNQQQYDRSPQGYGQDQSYGYGQQQGYGRNQGYDQSYPQELPSHSAPYAQELPNHSAPYAQGHNQSFVHELESPTCPPQGYNQQGYGPQQQYGQQPPYQQQQNQPYGGQPVQRRPVNGSWKDV